MIAAKETAADSHKIDHPMKLTIPMGTKLHLL
jgi:hypothetical protein